MGRRKYGEASRRRRKEIKEEINKKPSPDF
jgi:hypothetical protein